MNPIQPEPPDEACDPTAAEKTRARFGPDSEAAARPVKKLTGDHCHWHCCTVTHAHLCIVTPGSLGDLARASESGRSCQPESRCQCLFKLFATIAAPGLFVGKGASSSSCYRSSAVTLSLKRS